MSQKMLRKVEKTAKLALKKQSQEALSKIFSELSCGGVASQIKKGKDITGNVEFGIKLCVHEKLGPRVNVDTMKFTPMSAKAKKIERKFVEYANVILKNGGFRKISPKLLPSLAKGDKAFERKIAKRRKKR